MSPQRRQTDDEFISECRCGVFHYSAHALAAVIHFRLRTHIHKLINPFYSLVSLFACAPSFSFYGALETDTLCTLLMHFYPTTLPNLISFQCSAPAEWERESESSARVEQARTDLENFGAPSLIFVRSLLIPLRRHEALHNTDISYSLFLSGTCQDESPWHVQNFFPLFAVRLLLFATQGQSQD